MEIKIKQFKEGKFPKIIRKGDWIDLYTAEDIEIKGPIAGTRKRIMKKGITTTTRPVTLFNTLIPLNVAMKLPDGCEAYLLPRSSTFIKHGIIMANYLGYEFIDAAEVIFFDEKGNFIFERSKEQGKDRKKVGV